MAIARLAQRVKEERKRLDWTQQRLAEEVSRMRRQRDDRAPQISIDTISRLENGDNARTDTLEDVAAALGTTVLALMLPSQLLSPTAEPGAIVDALRREVFGAAADDAAVADAVFVSAGVTPEELAFLRNFRDLPGYVRKAMVEVATNGARVERKYPRREDT